MLKKRIFWQHFMTAIAGAASFATLVSFLFDCKPGSACWFWPVLLTALIVIVCFVFAWWMCRSKSSVEIEISTNFTLTIEEGNLLDRELSGVIVIPVNTHFNPHSIGRRTSVFFQFVQTLWKERMNELDEKIHKALREAKDFIKAEGTDDSHGYNTEYKLGTCIEIMDGGNIYVLVAAAEKDQKMSSSLQKSDYPKVIEKLFEFLAGKNYQKMIYLPLLGTGHRRLQKSYRRSLYFFLDAIEFKHSDLSFPDGVCLKLKSLQKSEINLTDVEHDFRLNIKG